MRQPQKNNRARNKGGRKSSGAAVNRVYESNGPEGKVRGTPQQIIEKYQTLARDKATAGDRILAESFLQHAEHYARILTAAQAANAVHQRREEEVEDETDVEAGRDKQAAGMAVMGDEGEAEAQPENLSAERRAAAPSAEGEGGSRRSRRRVSRRGKSEDKPAAEAAPSGFEVVEPSPGESDGGLTSEDAGWSESEPAPVAGAAVN